MSAALARGGEAVETGARAGIDHLLAWLERLQQERIGHPGERLHRNVGHGVNHRRVVPQALGQRPAGMEVVLAVGIGGDIAVLALHLFAQHGGVDRQLRAHGVLLSR